MDSEDERQLKSVKPRPRGMIEDPRGEVELRLYEKEEAAAKKDPPSDWVYRIPSFYRLKRFCQTIEGFHKVSVYFHCTLFISFISAGIP